MSRARSSRVNLQSNGALPSRLDQPVAHQGPIDARPPRERLHAALAELEVKPRRPPRSSPRRAGGVQNLYGWGHDSKQSFELG
jgi:hypothetical protein